MTRVPAAPAAEPEALPDHLIALPASPAGVRWALWRTLVVRGAGFPVKEVLRLGDPECAAAADRLIAAEQEAEELRERALEALRGLVMPAGERAATRGAIRRAVRGKVPATEGLPAAAASAVAAWAAALPRAEAAREDYRRAFEAAEEHISRELREIAGSDRFREAILWQNRHAVATGLAIYVRRQEATGRGTARDRGHEQMLASYLQRYCTKNDTIGFFGPVGWGRLGDGDGAVSVRPGPNLLAARQVFFEGWAIDALADRLAADPAIRPGLAPRRSPLLRREGGRYLGPGGQKVELGPISLRMFAACDGTRPARDIVRELVMDPALKAPPEATFYDLLAELHEKGLLFWGFQIPLTMTPEVALREMLLEVGDAPARERGLALLDELIAGRDAVARAAGSAGELDGALARLEESFVAATGLDPKREHGKIYSGRTLIHEDCRRDLDLELGAGFLADLGPALSVVLTAARWFTHHVATHHRELLAGIHGELARETGSPTVDLVTFSRRALPGLVNPGVLRELRRELDARWERVLAPPPGERRVARASADLWPLALSEFAAPGPGWQQAWCHSPDLLIAAQSVEAIQHGDYEVVLGELHVAVNTLDRAFFVSQHPDPETLLALFDVDLPGPTVVPLLPKHWRKGAATASLGFLSPGATARVQPASRSARSFYLDLALDPPGVDRSRLLAMGELVVEPHDGRLAVGPRQGEVRFDLVDFFQMVMTLQAVNSFSVRTGGAHTPRITIDRLVLSRESWTFPAAELAFAHASAAAERFAGTRRWAAGHGMPRHLFVSATVEKKPFYLDLASPAFVEHFAKVVRRSGEKPEGSVTVAEMLPEPDRVWLPDAAGNRYTSELRLVAFERT